MWPLRYYFVRPQNKYLSRLQAGLRCGDINQRTANLQFDKRLTVRLSNA